MVGNMIEWNRPTAISDHIATWPVVSTVSSTTTNAPIENSASTVSGAIRRISTLPAKRPTIIPPHSRNR